MKIHLLSDLHLEFSMVRERLSSVEADVVVLAGDIHTGAMGIAWAGMTWLDRTVIYVPGNHEYYRRSYVEHRKKMRDVAAKYDNIHLLDRDAIVLGDNLFLGATLWTDFEYMGKGDLVRQASAMAAAACGMHDFHLIRTSDDADGEGRRFMPEDSIRIHRLELEFLQHHLHSDLDVLAAQFGVNRISSRVVVTHHLPSSRSVDARYADSDITPAFASCLDETVSVADFWLHGHTHDSYDYHIEGKDGHFARVVCNPRGYVRFENDVENSAFDPFLVIEI